MILSIVRRLGCALLLTPALLQAAPQHAITLYGEAPKYPANFKHFDYVNPQAPKGGTLRQAGFGSYDSFNPFINKGVAEENIGLIYDTLTKRSADEPFSEYGLLAQSIERDSENRWVRYRLRPEARFADGQAVTAEDVVFTFNSLMQHGTPLYKAYYADIEQVVAEDRLTVRFDFKHANNRELPMITGQLPILPKHWWATHNFAQGKLEPPLGSGPYQIASFQAGRSIRYERVKNWWGEHLAVNAGQNNFDVLEFDYYRDNTVALEALKAGQFDFWLETSAKNWASAYDVPAIKSGQLIKTEIANHNPAGMQGFVFNLRRPLFQDVRVRKALGLLFDFEWTNKNLFNGAYTRTQSYFANSELAATALPHGEELKLLEPSRAQLPVELFTQPFKVEKTDGSGMLRPQQREAYRLLQEAGWKIDGEKMLDAQGQPVKIEFLLAQTEFERVLLPYKRNLRDLGIDLEIRRVDVSQYLNRLRSRDFDMLVGSYPQSSSPGNEQREYFHSSSAEKPGSRNFMGLKDPTVDRLVEGLINANSHQQLIDYCHALDRTLLWGYYVVPNWHITTWRVAYWNKLKRPAVTPPYDIGLMTWWIDPASSAPAAKEQP